MAVVTRLNSVTYAGLKVGEGTSYTLAGPLLQERRYHRHAVEFTVIIRADDAAAMLALLTPLETAYRTINTDLTIVVDSETITSWSHSGNTGMNSRPQLIELEDYRTFRSRAFRCRVEFDLPADETGAEGQQSSRTVLETDDSGIRTISIEAVYTALPGPPALSALAAAQADFPTFVLARQTDAGGEWDETDSVQFEYDKENKLCTATTAYREIVFNQSAGVADDLDLVLAQYNIRAFRRAVPQLTGSGALEPVTIQVEFQAFVPVSRTQALDELAESKVRPYVRQLAGAHAQAAGSPIEQEWQVNVDPVNNTVGGRALYLVPESSLIRAQLRYREAVFSGLVPVPVLDANPFARDRHESPAAQGRQLTWLAVELGEARGIGLDEALLRYSALAQAKRETEAAGFVFIDGEAIDEDITRELRTGGTLRLRETVAVMNFDRADFGEGATRGGAGDAFRTRTR